MSKSPKNDLAGSLEAAFAYEGSSFAGSRLLFAPEGKVPHDLRNLTWTQAAKRINDIVDISLIHSMSAEDFRYYLPGFILGIAVYLDNPETSLLGETVFFQLLSRYKPQYWDGYFVERWCRFTDPQYDLLVDLLAQLAPAFWEKTECERATNTLKLAQMRAREDRQNGR